MWESSGLSTNRGKCDQSQTSCILLQVVFFVSWRILCRWDCHGGHCHQYSCCHWHCCSTNSHIDQWSLTTCNGNNDNLDGMPVHELSSSQWQSLSPIGWMQFVNAIIPTKYNKHISSFKGWFDHWLGLYYQRKIQVLVTAVDTSSSH